jgi:hypothetical protein
MNNDLSRSIAWAGFASFVLVAIATALAMTKLNWLGAPVLVPGLLAAAIFFPQGPHSDHAVLYLPVAVVSDFFLLWLLFLIALRVFRRFAKER